MHTGTRKTHGNGSDNGSRNSRPTSYDYLDNSSTVTGTRTTARSATSSSPRTETIKDVNAKARAVKAVQLRTQGLNYREIASRCGYTNASGAFKAVNRELNLVSFEGVEELRAAELAMLNKMQSEIWPLMMDKENKGRLFAADRLLAISERRSKLMGLDVIAEKAMFANQIVIRETPFSLPVQDTEKTLELEAQ